MSKRSRRLEASPRRRGHSRSDSLGSWQALGKRRLRFEPLEARRVLDSTVVFNEVMYHPPNDDDGALEWIELYNQMAVNLDISKWTIEGGVDFSFPDNTIIPGFGYLVVAGDPAALESQSGYADALGPLVGRLDNGGERITLINNNDRVMNEIDYDDQGRWPVGPDGLGATLAKRDPNAGSKAPENWATSFVMGGTPGASNFPGSPPPTLTINEMAGGKDAEFWLEIINNGDDDLDLGGYAIQIAGATDRAYVFSSTTLGAGAWTHIVQNTLGFSAAPGDRLFLLTPGARNVLDAVVVGDTLLGRSPDGTGDMLFPATATPGGANFFQFHDEIVINEIMYHHRPESGDGGQPFREIDEEWIELYNQSDHSVELTGWKMVDGFQYAFIPGTMLDAGQYLVVAKDANALAAKYPAIADRIVGDYSGRLNNESDRIELVDAVGNPADEVHYFQEGRWPKAADGRGSSLELRDTEADNAVAEAWAASIEDDDSTWQTYSYRGRAAASAVGPDGRWDEFVLGLLGWGEVLLDDISVIESPGRNPIQLIQNGSFESDRLGAAAGAWRIIGNHRHSEVIVDPTDAANQVLRLVATGPTEHMHNHAETTLANGLSVTNGRTYEISFRAKWVTGSNQLNTRLYFNRLPATTLIAQSEYHGTPAARNSVFEANVGPTYLDFTHSPAVPQADQPISVSVVPSDSDGLGPVTLWWAKDGDMLQSTAMTPDADGKYHGTIPGHRAGDVVQFYVQAQDALGAASTYPSAGSDSRALIKIDDNLAVMDNVHNVRIIMTSSDAEFLHTVTNVMSYDNMRATVVYDETEVFYNVGVRLRASQRHRTSDNNVSFTLRFDPDHLFRDVHETVAVDRSGSQGDQDVYEAIIEPAFHHAGGIPDLYSDIIHVNTPKDKHNAFAMLKMARYEDDFLDEQFENGSDGERYKMELIYYPTRTVDGDPESLKLPVPDNVIGTDFRDLGDDKEAYRWNFILKNNRMEDDYSSLIEFSKTLSLSGAALEAAAPLVMDIDQWMRTTAMISLTGAWDQYIQGPQALHNMMVYVRPEDNRMIMLPWDLDTAFKRSPTQPLYVAKNLQKIIEMPPYKRLLFGHFQDIIETTYNTDYMAQWTEHFGELARKDYSSKLKYIGDRVVYVTSQLPASFDFSLSDTGPVDVGEQSAATVGGRAWVDVREIRLAGTDRPLDVSWITDQQTSWADGWQVAIPVEFGTHDYTFEAFNHQGQLVGSETITVTSTDPDRPLRDYLRITELDYHPADPTAAELAAGFDDADEFEFIELRNVGTEPLDLLGAGFIDAIGFEFVSTVTPTPVLISEAGVGDPDFFELQNVSGESVDTTGWFVAVNDAVDDEVGATYTTVWKLPASMSEDQVLYSTDVSGDNHFGRNIHWTNEKPGWVVLADGDGNPIDFVAWGYSETEIASLSINVPGHSIQVADIWHGPGLPLEEPGKDYLGRHGDSDNDMLSDWTFNDSHTRGTSIPALTSPMLGELRLEPGEAIVVAKDPNALAARHGTELAGVNVVGPYDGKLKNGGERLILATRFGLPILDFTYDDSGAWPGRADGNGSSLEILDPMADYNDPTNWRSSSEFGGSPGTVGSGPRRDVWVNEVLSNTNLEKADAIELHNATTQDIDIGGWYLSDSNNDFRKFRIPDETILAAGQYLVFNESQFNPEPPGTGFALSGAYGDDVWLLEADATGRLQSFVDHVEFGAAPNGESFGRWPDAEGPLYPMRSVTLGSVNAGPRVGPIIVSEVMYHPAPPPGGVAEDFEFIEISNPRAAVVDLTGWRLRGTIDFDFPSDVELAPGESIVVVPFDQADVAKLDAFRSHYGVDASVVILGGHGDPLDDLEGRITLQRGDDPPLDEPAFMPHLVEDEVIYGSAAPWPAEPAGDGSTLTRRSAVSWGNDPVSWIAAEATPGQFDAGLYPGDANLDDVTDVRDFMIWNTNKFTSGTDWTTGDFNGDGTTDVRDFMIWNAHKFTWAPAPPPALTQIVDDVFDAKRVLPMDLAWLSEWLDSASAQDDDEKSDEVTDKVLALYWIGVGRAD